MFPHHIPPAQGAGAATRMMSLHQNQTQSVVLIHRREAREKLPLHQTEAQGVDLHQGIEHGDGPDHQSEKGGTDRGPKSEVDGNGRDQWSEVEDLDPGRVIGAEKNGHDLQGNGVKGLAAVVGAAREEDSREVVVGVLIEEEKDIEAEMMRREVPEEASGTDENGTESGVHVVEKDDRDGRGKAEEKAQDPKPVEEAEKPKKEPLDLLRTKTGGAYIPPAKLRMMQDQIKDKEGEQYQRMNWERLKKKIHGLVNKVNTGNLVQVVRALLQENVIRGKGLLVRSLMQAQAFSPVFSHVYAAFVAVINSKFPHVGELLLRRLIVQFKRSFRRNDKGTTVTVSKFIAHLINQRVAHEVLALEIMILMMETPTDDSVEVSIAFLKECGAKLMEVSPRALDTIFTRLRGILQEGDSSNLDKRVQYMIEVMLTIFKDKFRAYPAVIDDLDLIDEEDQITHTITLEDAVNPENELNVFKLDPEFEKNEKQYEEIRAEIIGDENDSDEEGSDDDENDSGDDGTGQPGAAASTGATTEIIDNTEQNLVAFRREVYLTIQSSLDFQEAAHKLLKMKVSKELEAELCHMLVDCCCQQRTYERFYGLLCERFCRLRKEYQMTFEKIACDTYATIHRFDITKLRNMARLISHLLFTDAISWTIFTDVKLTEDDTTSSGRIYLKYIFQELCESMGLTKLYERVSDPTLQQAFAGLFPRDNPQNTRFAINFFTLTGLGGLTYVY
ncbi:unnamed protein product [Nippostrongylus brasiliensis]|uniref:Lethal protein 858 n=1 Tax=Nippostrongylus brasiliensis TaxID=27835 RepID=A0A0N4Y349_NIPBR|nr:unnamed protein product [Nippostrongylus brasiliensis]